MYNIMYVCIIVIIIIVVVVVIIVIVIIIKKDLFHMINITSIFAIANSKSKNSRIKSLLYIFQLCSFIDLKLILSILKVDLNTEQPLYLPLTLSQHTEHHSTYLA